ncbi:hypothetical protein ACFSQ7_14070 [Paenibacillus rhizoplanae]
MPAITEIDEECAQYNRSRYKMAEKKRRAHLLAARGEFNPSGNFFEVGEAIRRVYRAAGIEKQQPDTWNAPTGPKPTIHAVFAEIEEAAHSNADAKSLYDKIKNLFHRNLR